MESETSKPYIYEFCYNKDIEVLREFSSLVNDDAFVGVRAELSLALNRLLTTDGRGLGDRLGVVHSDFKPANILIGRGGLVVLDWGKATRGSQLLDVGFAGFHLMCWIIERGLDFARIDSFVEGYGISGWELSREQMTEVIWVAASAATLVDAKRERETRLNDLPGAARRSQYFWSECVPNFQRCIRGFKAWA